ncbi:hypothetical protein BJV78DRAFT_1257282 [Lactifluus subvellereus]|nr:hypothetical protein BJV78DRAFT_1257282 [Lactifluus subvellereus]
MRTRRPSGGPVRVSVYLNTACMLPALFLEIALFAQGHAAQETYSGRGTCVVVCVWPWREHSIIKLCANGHYDLTSATGLGRSIRTAHSPIEVTHTSAVASQVVHEALGRVDEGMPCSMIMSMAGRGFNLR